MIFMHRARRTKLHGAAKKLFEIEITSLTTEEKRLFLANLVNFTALVNLIILSSSRMACLTPQIIVAQGCSPYMSHNECITLC